MSAKRIKGTVKQVWDTATGERGVSIIGCSGDADALRDGTPVEIVYREDVEIRPGQRWRYNARDISCEVIRDVRDTWAIVSGGHVLEVPGWTSQSRLQSWLNEHATLVPEGES